MTNAPALFAQQELLPSQLASHVAQFLVLTVE
jgi:hypothetical protein